MDAFRNAKSQGSSAPSKIGIITENIISMKYKTYYYNKKVR